MRAIVVTIFSILASACAAQTTLPDEVAVKGTGHALHANGELLEDYDPRPALVTKITSVPKPKFPAIDIHCHWGHEQDPAALLSAMDAQGVITAVDLSGGSGAQLDRLLKRFAANAPERLLIFCNIDFSQIDQPEFVEKNVAYLRDAKQRGVRGLKIFKSLGLTVKDQRGNRVPVDDVRLGPIFDACGQLGLPVLIHSGDPPPFFQPVDRFNERWLQLARHPDWSFAGAGFPTFEQVMDEHFRMIRAHPQTVFISAHMANLGDDLVALGRRLDECPNLYVDISGRVEELGRQPFAARKFFIRYQDRILFGTDRYPGRQDQPRNAIYYRFLETDDEYFKPYDHPFAPSGDWRIYGLALPDEVLVKVYNQNATRALANERPAK